MSRTGPDGACDLVTEDQGRRPGTTPDGLAGLKTPFHPNGRVTAGTDAVDGFGLRPTMRLVSWAFCGVPPEIMGTGPIPSTEKALRKAGLTIDWRCWIISASTTTTPGSTPFAERPDVRHGLTAMCVGLGQGGSVIRENPHHGVA